MDFLSDKSCPIVIMASKGDDLEIFLKSEGELWVIPGGLPLYSDVSLDLNPIQRNDRTIRPILLWMEDKERLSLNLGEWTKLSTVEELAPGHGEVVCDAVSRFYFGMPGFSKDLAEIGLPQKMKKSDFNTRAVFFGGSFNPWHEGHLACCQSIQEGPVMVVPDNNPLKSGTESTSCPWQRFVQLCNLLESTSYSVYPGFSSLSQGNATSSWLPQCSMEEKVLLIGQDNFSVFDQWQDWEALAKCLTEIFVVPRKVGADNFSTMEKKLLAINSQLVISVGNHHDFEELSSSKIRSR